MPSDLASYLASNYLTADAPKTKTKKRKRRQADGLIFADDDVSGWGVAPNGDDRDEIAPIVVAGTSAEFAKSNKSSWKTLAGGERETKTKSTGDESAAADAILASVAAETEAARHAEDEGPVVEGMDLDSTTNPNVQRMGDGTLAGLQSAASLSAQAKNQKKKEREAWEREKGEQQDQEMPYRDATGRRVDVSLQREAARKAALEAEQKEIRKVEALKGEIQVEEARLRRQKLAQAKNMTLARKADDEEMNREMKEQERWNDPMARFLAEQKQTGGMKKKGAKGRPIYTGPAPPNRYGIRPGYRWDGVDRGNGFEAERFKALNRRERNKGLEYAWQMDE